MVAVLVGDDVLRGEVPVAATDMPGFSVFGSKAGVLTKAITSPFVGSIAIAEAFGIFTRRRPVGMPSLISNDPVFTINGVEITAVLRCDIPGRVVFVVAGASQAITKPAEDLLIDRF